MVKLQIVSQIAPDSGLPPKIPPRMKRRGPALPEKPAHMRVHPSPPLDGKREVLVAATRTSREKPVEKRQREPAKLILPTKKEHSADIHRGQPILLIPQNMLPWNTFWIPSKVRREPESGILSKSVTRSSSLSSQDSDSGNETFPKSVLKKQKRGASNESVSNCRRLEQKKNVTFNAFATVQLVGE